MPAFIDETRLEVCSGDGGPGCSSFRREKYVPKGGPDGGDGGKGGDLVFETRRNLATLSHLRGNTLLKAENGSPGRGRRMHGSNGKDKVLFVPPGTRISLPETGEILHDFAQDEEGQVWICLKGGQGGLGNWHFRSSRRQRPLYAQPGKSGEAASLQLELSMIADAGLIGLPSAGKSSLLNALTAAKSRVGAYPFTTKIPHLGVLRRGEKEVIIADIPGLIEGASQGLGLGHQFLRHVGRTRALVYLTDLSEEDPRQAVGLLEKELAAYNRELLEKPRILLGSKMDCDQGDQRLEQLAAAFPGDLVKGISVFTREGLDDLVKIFFALGNQPQL